jgi:beta-galactosidase
LQQSIAMDVAMRPIYARPMHLGVCYYPEHWPEDWWAGDARRMAEMGLSRVRIGEFAWSRIEPAPEQFDWGWLDRAVDVLHAAGLKIIMGTPTATPPRWMLDKHPDMLAIDDAGRPRKFGSRRHYCFAHLGYRDESARITTLMAERYGAHPAIVAWQTDNEYGCHDTAVSYSASAAAGFRKWLAAKYADVHALNAAWGNVFWSMDYASFDQIDPPNLTVTGPNHAHVLDWRRFSSDQVVAFNRIQTDILRAKSPGRDIMHNYMGFFTQFDHHAVSRDLDVAGWDSYPLGFLEQFDLFTATEKARYAAQGHPDLSAFHHDLYRGMTGRWWVVEQQPGPVNWAQYNPAPLPGMVRLWTLEAMAHGAELVSYFRWRQAPFAQEQMHSGLLRPDRSDDVAVGEVRVAARDIGTIGSVPSKQAPVALIFSYEAAWTITAQPQGGNFTYLKLVFAFYTALRRLGLDIDILAPDADLTGYAMVVVPTLPILHPNLVDIKVPVLFGPRTGSKTADFAIPDTLPPGPLQARLPIRVLRVETHREEPRWRETVEAGAGVTEAAGVFRKDNIRYLSRWPDADGLADLFTEMTHEAGLTTTPLPEDLRIRRLGDLVFAFNYGPEPLTLDGAHDYLIGGATLAPADVAVWRAVG